MSRDVFLSSLSRTHAVWNLTKRLAVTSSPNCDLTLHWDRDVCQSYANSVTPAKILQIDLLTGAKEDFAFQTRNISPSYPSDLHEHESVSPTF